MIRIEEYVTEGASPFRRWFDDLAVQAAASVSVAIERLAEGNTSNVKPIGEGAAELKINRGPGYRVYFGWDGKVLVILLGGGAHERCGAEHGRPDPFGPPIAGYEALPEREDVVGRLPGSGGGRSLILNGHVDVVPAHAPEWTVHPFSGAVQDGLWLVSEGLKDGDRVVVDGFQKFVPGDKVKPKSLQIFSVKGYYNTSISDIMAATGLTKRGTARRMSVPARARWMRRITANLLRDIPGRSGRIR